MALGGVCLGAAARAEEVPPPPARYFNDAAGLVSPEDATRLDAKLARFDTETSNQIVVAVFPALPSPSLEDFTIRTAQAWRVGRKKLDNGAVLFVFVKDHKVRLEVGYGLEGALPDAIAKRIIDDVLTPPFRAGHYAQGLDAAIDAMMAATRGEYKPPAQRADRATPFGVFLLAFVMIDLFIVVIVLLNRSRGSWATYGSGGWGGTWSSGGLSGSSGGGWSSGSSSGGFSGGGGSFGGGGASGSW